MTARLALLLKSYGGDAGYAERLLASFDRHNPTGLHLYCVVPAEDLPLFAPLAGPQVTVLDEGPFARHLVNEPVAGLRPGYVNQEIIKLAFHQLGLAENYFCVDSDAVFIRDIAESDFIAPDGSPYTVLVEDNDLQAEPAYYRQYWVDREPQLRRIADLVGYRDPVLRTCHGHQIFSSTVLASFVTDFLTPRGWDYRDAIAESPYEFTWYNLWLQATGTIPIHPREPLVKVYHHEGQHLEAILRGITEADLARGYLAVVVNSSFARNLASKPVPGIGGVVSGSSGTQGPTKAEQLAPYLSYQETAALVLAKLRDTARRRLGRSG